VLDGEEREQAQVDQDRAPRVASDTIVDRLHVRNAGDEADRVHERREEE
jgi:hypothetical protein